MRTSLFRKPAVLGLVLATLTSLPASAQYAARQRKTSPRAIAVLQITSKGTPRLFPVCIWSEGKLYDGRFYQAKPVPMTLYGDTVYEAIDNGASAGLFTVHLARRVDTTWWGEGDWNPASAAVADSSKADKSKADKAEDKDRPTPKKPSDTDNDRPTLKKPDDKSEDKSEKKDTGTTKPDDDPDRPVFRKSKSGEPQQEQVKATMPQTYSNPSPADDDPDRPRLRRGAKPQEKPDEPLAPVNASVLTDPNAKYLVAVSDPDPMELRPYDYVWSDAEQRNYEQKISAMALAELKKWAATNTRNPFPSNAQLANVSMRALDVDFSNSPYIVFTAEIQPPATTQAERMAATVEPKPFYISMVFRMTMQGEMRPLLSLPTDASHLDVNPRLQLIDAVDVDGDHRAELLFRKVGENRDYVIYRLTPFQITQIFEGGSGN